jgi:DNA-binding transcriptional ArsR family regulator
MQVIFSYEYIDISWRRTMNTAAAEHSFRLISKRLKAIADPSRMAILHILCEGERNVSELTRSTGLSQANVSKHLRILREEGLVSCRRDHRKIFYELANEFPKAVCLLVCRSLAERVSTDKEILESYWRAQSE